MIGAGWPEALPDIAAAVSPGPPPGLIAAVSGFLADAGLNIVDADQHSSTAAEGRFFHPYGLRPSA